MAQRHDHATNATDRASGLTTGSVGSFAAPKRFQLPRPPGITLLSSNVWAADPMMTKLVGSSDRPLPENGTNSTARVRLYYIAEAVVKYQECRRTIKSRSNECSSGQAETFSTISSFGISPETEFHPGAPMYVDGTVYAGGNLYTATITLYSSTTLLSWANTNSITD
jgi:hypothetical protein